LVALMPMTTKAPETRFATMRERIETTLANLLPAATEDPRELHEAMRYSVLAGGKRIRPVLAISSYYASGGADDTIYRYACALELLHTYSLIHDDLPCMDDDDFRRGKPTLHRKFSEYIAVLAGDALHALAFEILASSGSTDVIREVSQAIGTQGMIGGQVRDVEAEGRDVDLQSVEAIHLRKTAALIRASVKIGAMLAGAPTDVVLKLAQFGERLGLAFQIIDDVLDVEGDFADLGKATGADSRLSKATYPKVLGVERSREEAIKLIAEAKSILAEFPQPDIFYELADYVVARKN
jgi:geranylgeranyl diphosphate synthase type II